MQYLPIFIKLLDEPCLVVGGGGVAVRKVRQLIKAKAQITIVAPTLCKDLQRMLDKGQIQYLSQPFAEQCIHQKTLVIAATNDAAINRTVSILARQKNILVNVVDMPDLCSFIMPATIDRGPLQIAISTGGNAPMLARLLRARLETSIPSSFGQLVDVMKQFREKIKQRYPRIRDQRRFWEQVFKGSIAELLYAGDTKTTITKIKEKLVANDIKISNQGEVYLVGGGPGDPELLTFRALRLMQQADTVIYDRLVAKEIVDLTRRDAERIYVGKQRDQHILTQKEINQLLIKLANQGKRVLRLKGGDPFIFGRGGEEIESLFDHNIHFQVVPGITAANACAAYAGIPLTHRDYAQSCIFLTGHLKNKRIDFNWRAVIQPQQTLVIYMGIANLPLIVTGLIDHGLSEKTPAAIIERGTTNQQRVYAGTVKSLPDISAQYNIKPPGLIIIGEVVSLRDKLAWRTN